MGAGIRIDYMDGTRPIEITSGMIAPSLILEIPGNYNTNTLTFPLRNRMQGSQLLVIPISCTVLYGPAVIATYNGFVDHGDSITIRMYNFDIQQNVTSAVCSLLVFQYPVGDPGAGIKLEDSSDFTKITTGSQCCRLLKRQRISFNTRWEIPTINGVPPQQQLIAAQWDNSSVVVARSDSEWNKVPTGGGDRHYLTAYPNRQNQSPNSGSDITLDLLIYGPGYPDPGNAGIRILNERGECTFSTKDRPLVLANKLQKAESSQSCDGMIILDTPGHFGYRSGDYSVIQNAGYVMHAGTLKVGFGQPEISYPGRGGFKSKLSDTPTLILPPLY